MLVSLLPFEKRLEYAEFSQEGAMFEVRQDEKRTDRSETSVLTACAFGSRSKKIVLK